MENKPETQAVVNNALGLLQKVTEHFDSQQTASALRLGAKFFSTRKKAFVAVLDGEADASISVQEEGYVFNLKQPLFLDLIKIDGSSSQPKVRLEYWNITDEKWNSAKTVPSDSAKTSVFEIKAYTTAFRLSSAKEGFLGGIKKEYISAITTCGWTQEDLAKLPEEIERFEEIYANAEKTVSQGIENLTRRQSDIDASKKALAAQAEKTKSAQAEELAKHQAALDDLNAKIETAQESLEETEGSLEENKKNLTEEEKKLSQLKASIGTLLEKESAQRKILAEQEEKISLKDGEIKVKTEKTTELSVKLQQLHNDNAIFADDTQGLAKQGSSQVSRYLWIVGICVVAGLALAVTIVVMAIYLASLSLTEGIKAEDILLIRLPLAAATCATLYFLYHIAKPFINRIIYIDDRKMKISEIGMLVRDATEASLQGATDIDDTVREAVKLEARISIIRDFASGSLDRNADGKARQLPDDCPTGIRALKKLIQDRRKKSSAPERAPESGE